MGTSILCIKYTLSVLSCCSDSRRARSSVAPAGQRHPQGGTCHPLRSPASKARTLGMPKGRRRDLESRWAERGMIWKGKTMELPLLLPYGCATSLHHPLLSQIPPFPCISMRRNSFSKMILPNPNHKQHFLLFLFLKKPFFLLFCLFFFFLVQNIPGSPSFVTACRFPSQQQRISSQIQLSIFRRASGGMRSLP